MNPDPARMNGISKGELYVAASGAPKRVVLYEGTTLVEQDEFTNQNLSPKISARDFST
jgi:ATP-dependent exoDNAse (exonuclease V) alpha subunit